MTTREAPSATNIPTQRRDDSGPDAWLGWIGFAGIMMIMVGIFAVIEGLAGIFRHTVYVVSHNGLLVTANYTAWGWTHLILGVIVVASGFGVLSGRPVARFVGIVLALLNATLNLAFLSAYPIWSTIMIALDVVVIYALAVHGGEARNRV